jgi:hypothetical protein
MVSIAVGSDERITLTPTIAIVEGGRRFPGLSAA